MGPHGREYFTLPLIAPVSDATVFTIAWKRERASSRLWHLVNIALCVSAVMDKHRYG
jgi:hypothetical protein